VDSAGTPPGPEAVRVWLIGSMGSGKTSVGAALVDMLDGWRLLDNDAELEAFEGRSAVDLAEHGAGVLHAREAAQARRLVDEPVPFVAGIAASVTAREEDLAVLRATGLVVYLRASAATLASRISDPASRSQRPWLSEEPERWLEARLAEREPASLAAAHLVIDVDHLTPQEVAGRIRSVLGSSTTS
jgi:shikimate kinase